MKKVKDSALISPLFDLISIALFLHIHDFLALDVENMLAAL